MTMDHFKLRKREECYQPWMCFSKTANLCDLCACDTEMAPYLIDCSHRDLSEAFDSKSTGIDMSNENGVLADLDYSNNQVNKTSICTGEVFSNRFVRE